MQRYVWQSKQKHQVACLTTEVFLVSCRALHPAADGEVLPSAEEWHSLCDLGQRDTQVTFCEILQSHVAAWSRTREQLQRNLSVHRMSAR